MKSFGAGPGGELIGDENTGTNQLDPASVDVRSGQRGQGRAESGSGSADAPYGYGPDGNPVLGPSSVAPFGYGPDGNPLTKLDPRAPNGYGPDGRPLPGTACSAPFGLGLNGQPLSAPDPKAPFGYHPSDGQPVATNDPTAPFGYGRDGNPLSARDPSAPLGYGLNGQPNLSPETVSFCGDSTAPSQMGVPRFLGQGTNTSQGNFGRNGVEAGSQGGCDGNGVMYFAQGGTNVILSYDPARVTDCQPPIRHMANAASSGMEVGCDGGLVDVATVMRQAMEGLLSRVSNMMGGISGQNGGQGCICQCPCQRMNNNNNSLPLGSGGGVQRMRSEEATVGTAGTRGFSAGDPMSDPRRFSPGLSPLDQQLPLTGTDYRVQTPPTGTATGTDSGLVTCSNSQFQINGEDCAASAAASGASVAGEADIGTGSGEEPKKKKCSRSQKKKCKPKVKDVSTDVASKNAAGRNGSNSSERDNSSESGPRRRCIPKELRQFVPGTKVGPDGKLPPGAMDNCGGPPPIPPRLGGSAALGELCDAGGAGAFGARTVGKYLQDIAPQYQNLLDTALTPEDQETLTLLTAVGTLLDRIENTGVTRMDPIQLCTDQTLVELTQMGDSMLISLKEHLVKFKSSPQRILEANDSDPLMAQISKEAYDALEIGADSLDVAVGLLKDVIKLCGEMAGHPELLEKCAADIAMARQKNEDQMQDITNKQLTACQQAFQQQNADRAATATATTGAGTDSGLDGQMDGTQTDGVSSVEEGSDAMSVTARALGNRGLSSSLPGSTTNAAAIAKTGNDGINDGVAGSGVGSGSGSNVDFGAGSGAGYGTSSDADADGVAGRGLGGFGSEGEASTNANNGGNDDNLKSDVLDVSRLMGENLSSVTNLLNGTSGNSRTRRMMFITVSFLLGAAIGYAIARSYGIVGPHSRMSELLWGSARCPTGISKIPVIPLGGGCNRCVARTPNVPL